MDMVKNHGGSRRTRWRKKCSIRWRTRRRSGGGSVKGGRIGLDQVENQVQVQVEELVEDQVGDQLRDQGGSC